MTREIIELIFSAALFLNALLFVPQAARIFIEKSAKGVSLTTFLGFLIIQLAIILHALTVHDRMLLIGYALSLLTCGSVVVLALFYRRHDKNADVSKPKQEASDQLDFLENIIAEMPGNVYWMNREGIYLGCNNNQAKVIGLQSRKDIVGKRNVDIPGFLIPEALDPINEKVMQTAETIVTEEPAILPGGKHITVLSSKVPIKNNRNEVVGMLGISVDITDRKKAELGEIAAQVAHDIRSPLQVLDVLSHDLKKRFSDGESNHFTEAIKRIHDIATGLLDRYRQNKTNENEVVTIEKAYPLWLVLLKLINEKHISLAKQHPNIKLTLEPADDKTLSAIVEIGTLQRILSNLINNAIEAFNGIEKTDKYITTRLTTIANKVVIQVCDNGKGIDAERVEKFNNAKGIDSHGGHGLGLSHALEKLRAWGGDLKMESTVGQGTTLSISLPLTSPPTWLQLSLRITRDTIVFLVDDDEVTLFRLKDILIKKGISADQLQDYQDIDLFISACNAAKKEQKDIFVLMDQVLANNDKTGVDVLIEQELASHSLLITNDIFNQELQNKITQHRIDLLPKPLFSDLVVDIETPITGEVEYVVLDDLTLVTNFWKARAKRENIKIATFNRSEEFMRYIAQCDKDIKIYLDNDLGENITGLELSKKLRDMGFKNIFMMTSHHAISPDDYPWITAVVGKGGPFDDDFGASTSKTVDNNGETANVLSTTQHDIVNIFNSTSIATSLAEQHYHTLLSLYHRLDESEKVALRIDDEDIALLTKNFTNIKREMLYGSFYLKSLRYNFADYSAMSSTTVDVKAVIDEAKKTYKKIFGQDAINYEDTLTTSEALINARREILLNIVIRFLLLGKHYALEKIRLTQDNQHYLLTFRYGTAQMLLSHLADLNNPLLHVAEMKIAFNLSLAYNYLPHIGGKIEHAYHDKGTDFMVYLNKDAGRASV